MTWIDSHCHLDAAEFAPDRDAVRQAARAVGVHTCVIPAVQAAHFDAVRQLAHQHGDVYALGIHPLFTPQAREADLQTLDQALTHHRADPRLVAVGEIGLDYFVPEVQASPLRERQEDFYRAQLKLAKKHNLPVVLHVRKSADQLLKALREVGGSGAGPYAGGRAWTGIAHAFNGSEVQAQEFIKLGFKLGFGGAVTFERALQLRHLAQTLPLDALVLETDAPDIPPHWLYATAQERAAGASQGRNEPGELPRIAQVVAQLRGMPLEALAQATCANACSALPRLGALLV